MGKHQNDIYQDREISWLGFNARVLQEANDPSVPLFDRLAFLAIYSSNLDEFFRVRVASLRSLLRLKKKSLAQLDFNPARLLKQIHRIVTAQQEEFGQIYRHLLRQLEGHGIFLIDERKVTEGQEAFLRSYFEAQVRPHLQPRMLAGPPEQPFLRDKQLYLVVELWPHREAVQQGGGDPDYALVEVPSTKVPRFVRVPGYGPRQYVMFLDDVLRYNLPALFPEHEVGAAYAVKLSRDAELYLEDEFSGNLIEKIRKSLAKREGGLPSRFLYDLQMPYAVVAYLQQCLGLEDEDMVPGGRYHNLHDLHGFPRFGLKEHDYKKLPPLAHPALEAAPSVLAAVAEKDRMLHFPYQSFGYVLRFLEEAAQDPEVEEIWITLYRVAPGSAVVEVLLSAAQQGKRVTAFVELKARFDEAPNLHWAERMEDAGVRVLYSLPGLKVHAKMALVARREAGALRYYAYLSTGNFNEKTARLYTDSALLTADPGLTAEVHRIFGYLAGAVAQPAFSHLLVAPFDMRERFYALIEREIDHAKAGRAARMILKMNSLEDEQIIARLYEASRAGVRIDLIVRGICCLVPGVKGQSETIRVRSIVDRFLEHARLYVFHNGGEEELYLTSADWMKRNLSHRVEVAFPVYDGALRRELRALLALQLEDDSKARIIDAQQRNAYHRSEGGPSVRAQLDSYRYLMTQEAEQAGSGSTPFSSAGPYAASVPVGRG